MLTQQHLEEAFSICLQHKSKDAITTLNTDFKNKRFIVELTDNVLYTNGEIHKFTVTFSFTSDTRTLLSIEDTFRLIYAK